MAPAQDPTRPPPPNAAQPLPHDVLEALRAQPPGHVVNLQTYPLRIAQARIVAHCTALGNPGVKQRPRFVRADGSVFTPKPTKDRQRDLGWTLKTATRALLVDDEAAFGVRLLFYVENAARKDIDNMVKLVFDATTGIVWADDSQVKELFAWVRRDALYPRTEILIYTLGFKAQSGTPP